MKRLLTLAVICTLSLTTACSSSGEKRKAEYKRSKSLPTLEVPPDLTAPDLSGDTLTVPDGVVGADSKQPRFLVTASNVQVKRDGNMYWLLVQADAEKLWDEVKGYWKSHGFELTTDEPAIGVMATNWLENRADIDTGFFQRMVSKVLPGLYSAATRDMFRTRFEKGEAPGSTEIYVTHYGVEEISVDSGDEFLDTKWQTRPTDVELINEMLLRLMVHLGVEEMPAQAKVAKAADQPARARISQDSAGQPRLVLSDAFARAWRRTGIALDRIGMVVEDRDRSSGLYYVKHLQLAKSGSKKEKGLLGGLFSGADKQAEQQSRIQLQAQGTQTHLTVLNNEGQPAEKAAASAIIEKLLGELR